MRVKASESKWVKKQEHQAMNTQAGLWIDHYEAVVVVLREERVVSVTHIPSCIEKDNRQADESHSATPYGSPEIASEQQMSQLFDNVANSIFRAQQIFIMGPGEVKGQLVRHLRKSNEMKSRHLAVESRDKMTKNQIVDAVKTFYDLLNNPGH